MSEELVQIHHVQPVLSWEYVNSEGGRVERRQVQKFMRSDTDRIVHPELGTFEIAPDGSFYVPVAVAEHFLRQPDWNPGPSPFAPAEPVAEAKPRAAKPRKPAGKAHEEE